MIGYIEGKVLDTDGKKALIHTALGVGYEINYTYYLEKDSNVNLYIHHSISENDQSLWGFNTLKDKKMFELLKTVNKVGSSKAYPLVSTVGTDEVISAIVFERADVLSQAPGIGKKMAEQIILSLKDKVEAFKSSVSVNEQSILVNPQGSVSSDSSSFDKEIFNDVMLALDSLGYKDAKVTKLVQKLITSGQNRSEEIIKSVLREI